MQKTGFDNILELWKQHKLEYMWFRRELGKGGLMIGKCCIRRTGAILYWV